VKTTSEAVLFGNWHARVIGGSFSHALKRAHRNSKKAHRNKNVDLRV
jgi:hypothetical protein